LRDEAHLEDTVVDTKEERDLGNHSLVNNELVNDVADELQKDEAAQVSLSFNNNTFLSSMYYLAMYY
jgi:hypothetical protein